MTKEIALRGGQIALVDDADYDWLSGYDWYGQKRPSANSFYAVRRELWNDGVVRRRGSEYRTIYMHRDIMGVGPKEAWVDHINRQGLDNRRENLRFCTPSQNIHNVVRVSNSGYRGVYKMRGPPVRYRAHIRIDQRWIIPLTHPH